MSSDNYTGGGKEKGSDNVGKPCTNCGEIVTVPFDVHNKVCSSNTNDASNGNLGNGTPLRTKNGGGARHANSNCKNEESSAFQNECFVDKELKRSDKSLVAGGGTSAGGRSGFRNSPGALEVEPDRVPDILPTLAAIISDIDKAVGDKSIDEGSIAPKKEATTLKSLENLFKMMPRPDLEYFISSPFTDTKLERFILMNEILPRLQQQGRKYGITITMFDMRFGVRDENITDQSLVQKCLVEIERCYLRSAKSFFLSFQGDKFGYRPIPRTIEKKSFEDRLSTCQDSETKELAKEWYKLDETLVPASYVLKPLRPVRVNTKFLGSDFVTWNDPEFDGAWVKDAWKPGASSKLRVELEGLPFEDCPRKDVQGLTVGTSVTALEHIFAFFLDRGGVEVKNDNSRIKWIRRRFKEPTTASEDPKRYYSCENEEERRILGKFTDDLEKSLEGSDIIEVECSSLKAFNIDKYSGNPGVMTKEGEDYKSDFSAKMDSLLSGELESLRHEIDQWRSNSLNEYGISGDILGEMCHHLNLSKQKCEHFKLNPSVSSLQSVPKSANITYELDCISMYFVGFSGTGKTSLMAKLYEYYRDRSVSTGIPAIIRFCGTSIQSLEGLDIMRSIFLELKFVYGIKYQSKSFPDNYEEAKLEFHKFLKSVPVILFIDGLDQLSPNSDRNKARSKISFLSGLKQVHPSSRIIVSCLPDNGHGDVNYGCETTLKEMKLPRRIVQSISVRDKSSFTDTLSLGQGILRDLLLSKYKIARTIEEWKGITQTLEKEESEQSMLYYNLAAKLLASYSIYDTGNNMQIPYNKETNEFMLDRKRVFLLGSSVEDVIFSIFKNMCHELGVQLVRHCLGFISFSKGGVNNSEILDLLSMSPNVMREIRSGKTGAYFSSYLKERLPSHVWDRVLFAFDGLIVEQSSNCWMWYHRQLREKAIKFLESPAYDHNDKAQDGMIPWKDVNEKYFHEIMGFYFRNHEEALVRDMEPESTLNKALVNKTCKFPEKGNQPLVYVETITLKAQDPPATAANDNEILKCRQEILTLEETRKIRTESLKTFNALIDEDLIRSTNKSLDSCNERLKEKRSELAKLTETESKRSITPKSTMSSSSVWNSAARINSRRCIECVYNLIASGQYMEAVAELCSIDGICARARSDTLKDALDQFKQLLSILQEQNGSSGFSSSSSSSSSDQAAVSVSALHKLRSYHRWIARDFSVVSLNPCLDIVKTAFEQPSESQVYRDLITLYEGYQPKDLFLMQRDSWFRLRQLGRPEMFDDRDVFVAHGHSRLISSVVINEPESPIDKRYMVSASLDKTVKVWDFETGFLVTTLKCWGQVGSVAISRDGNTVVSGSGEGIVRIWDVENERCTDEIKLKVHLENADPSTATFLNRRGLMTTSVIMSKDCSTIVVGSGYLSGSSRSFAANGIYSFDKSELSWTFQKDKYFILVFKKSSKWELVFHSQVEGAVSALCFSPDEKVLLSCSDDSYELSIWNWKEMFPAQASASVATTTPKAHLRRAYKMQIKIKSLNADEEDIDLVVEHSNTIKDVKEKIQKIKRIHVSDSSFKRFLLGFSGKILDDKSTLEACNIEDGCSLHILREAFLIQDNKDQAGESSCEGGIYSMSVKKSRSKSKEIMAFGLGNATTIILELSLSNTGTDRYHLGKAVTKLLRNHSSSLLSSKQGHPVYSVSLATEGSSLVSSSKSEILVWDVDKILESPDRVVEWDSNDTRYCKQSLAGQKGAVFSTYVSSSGQDLISGGKDGTLWRWNIEARMPIGSVENYSRSHSDCVTCLAVSEEFIVTGTGREDGTVKVWSAKNKDYVCTLRGNEATCDWITSVAISRDSSMIISGSADNMIRVWKRDDETFFKLSHSMAHCPHGFINASLCTEGELRYLDITCVKEKFVQTLAVSGNGAVLASGSNDGTVKVWDISSKSSDPTPAHDTLVYVMDKDNVLRSMPERGIWRVAMSDDGTRIVTAAEHVLQIWGKKESKNWTYVCDLGFAYGIWGDGRIRSLDMSNDGNLVVSGSRDGAARVWDISTVSLSEHDVVKRDIIPAILRSKSWSSNSSVILSVKIVDKNKILSCDNLGFSTAITAWERNEGTSNSAAASGNWEGMTYSLHRSKSRILDCIPSTDLKFFVSGHDNGTAVIWDAIPFQESSRGSSDGSNCSMSSAQDDATFSGNFTISISRGTAQDKKVLGVSEGIHMSGNVCLLTSNSVQKWNLINVHGQENVYCICLADPSSAAGKNIYLGCESTGLTYVVKLFAKDDGTGNQWWSLRDVGQYTYNIFSKGPKAQVGHEGIIRSDYLSCTAGGYVDLYHEDDGSGRQQWKITKYDKIVERDESRNELCRGYLRIVGTNSFVCASTEMSFFVRVQNGPPDKNSEFRLHFNGIITLVQFPEVFVVSNGVSSAEKGISIPEAKENTRLGLHRPSPFLNNEKMPHYSYKFTPENYLENVREETVIYLGKMADNGLTFLVHKKRDDNDPPPSFEFVNIDGVAVPMFTCGKCGANFVAEDKYKSHVMSDDSHYKSYLKET